MHPLLFDSAWIGLTGALHFTLEAYFVAILAGFGGAAWIATQDVDRMGVNRRVWMDFLIWMLIMGVLGSRIMHVLVDGFLMDYVHLALDPLKLDGRSLPSLQPCVSNAECWALQQQGQDIGAICNATDGLCYPQADPLRWLKFWAGGLTVYGSLIACVSFAWFYMRKHKMPLMAIMDLGGYGIFFGIAVGRLGCLAAGCCYGDLCDTSALGIEFPQTSLAYQHHFEEHADLLRQHWRAGHHTSLPVWPTQLISSVYNFLIFVVAYFVIRPRKRFHGQVLLMAAILYGVCRFMVEFIRADFRGGALGLSTSQLVSIPVVAGAIFLLIRALKRARASADVPDETPAPTPAPQPDEEE